MRAYERFLTYVPVYTRSDETSQTMPSTKRQFDLARRLVEELRNLGVEDAEVSDTCCVYGSLPATAGREKDPALGFLSHMDTADYEASNVRPLLHPHYDGGPVELEGRTLSPEMFPHLPDLKGQTLITASGDTLLGADDKAGIAEIMTMVEQISNLPHGKIAVAFTPDEEIGRGTEGFDVERFGADFAFTVDGGAAGEIEYENFNACDCLFTFHGVDVHPGSAKDVMVNALLLAQEAAAMVPAGETPRETEGYEGFYHLLHAEGCVAQATLRYLIRDHDGEKFAARKETLRAIEQAIREKWGPESVTLEIRDQYRNMAEIIRQHPWLLERAKRATKAVGLEPKILPIRGGTDGANLSFRGLPCPNLGTGGYAFHGPYEHITAEAMDQVTAMLVRLATEEFQ